MKKETPFTLPNLITLIRLILLFFFIWSLAKGNNQQALLFFIIMALSDKLDGYWARAHRQITNIGKILDSVTDGIIFLVTIVTLVALNRLALSWGLMLGIPKVITFCIGLFYIKKKKKLEWDVLNKGKIGTAFLYFSLIGIIVKFQYIEILLIATAVILYISTIEYIRKRH